MITSVVAFRISTFYLNRPLNSRYACRTSARQPDLREPTDHFFRPMTDRLPGYPKFSQLTPLRQGSQSPFQRRAAKATPATGGLRPGSHMTPMSAAQRRLINPEANLLTPQQILRRPPWSTIASFPKGSVHTEPIPRKKRRMAPSVPPYSVPLSSGPLAMPDKTYPPLLDVHVPADTEVHSVLSCDNPETVHSEQPKSVASQRSSTSDALLHPSDLWMFSLSSLVPTTLGIVHGSMASSPLSCQGGFNT